MKMTKNRQLQLGIKLQASRGRLMESYPFFGILLMYLGFVAVDNIRNISTNGRNIYFNADFITKLYPDELDFILCHQVMHIINGDIWRARKLVGDEYHRAYDIYNNDQLIGMGWDIDGFSHMGKLQYDIPVYNVKVSDLTPEEIFELLPFKLAELGEKTSKRYMTDSDFYWDYKNSDYIDGIVILDAPDMTMFADGPKGIAVGGTEELEDFWSHRVDKAATAAKGLGKKAGSIPEGIKRDIEKDTKRQVDWKKVLDEFVQEEVTDYSFTPPDRRYADTGFFLPDFNEKDFQTKDILFMADTSGSVKREELSRVYAEISGAIEQFNGKLRGKLGFFDCQVTEPISFEGVEDILSIAPYGGGGTSFGVIFEYVKAHLDEYTPAMIVIFTDGEASFPDVKATMNIPVLWLISNERITPPWGKVGRVI